MTVPTPPALRTVATSCLTEAGWIRGTFHVPLQQSFSDYLQNTGAFLPMTDVVLPARLRRQAVLRGAAGRHPAGRPQSVRGEHRDDHGAGIHVALERIMPPADGLLDGQIDFLTNQRLSDHLRIARGYLVVREAVLAAGRGGAGPGPDPCPVVLVNVARLVGIAEAETQRGHGHPGRYHTTAADYEIG
jgi:hypothetical protein